MGTQETFEADIYGGGKATYLGMEIERVGDSNFAGITPDSDNSEDEINQIEILHERTRRRKDALTEEEQAISRSELGEFIRIARIARTGAIYDDSAAAQTFDAGAMIDSVVENANSSANAEKGISQKERKNGFGHMPVFSKNYKTSNRMSKRRTPRGKRENGPVENAFYGI